MSHTPLRAGSKRLIDADKAVALFAYFGDAPVNAALPIIKKKRIALVGAVTGAEAHRNDPNPFFVRASDQMWAEKNRRVRNSFEPK